ncbi:MAG TPA: FAD-dependent oxidoreductase, partial [Polyangiaceae bacterium]|nr:FAD-dependent oxidoreductase [Polyangiaceae bacterium]
SPANYNGAMDWSPSGRWLPWKVDLPAMPGLPGDPGAPKLGVTDYLTRAASLVRTLLATLPLDPEHRPDTTRSAFPELGSEPLGVDQVGQALRRLLKYGALAGLGMVIEALGLLERILGSLPLYPQTLIAQLLDTISDLAKKQLAGLIEQDDSVRRLWEVVDLLLASLRGSIRFRLAFDPRGFDAIDDYDSREWLRLNGAAESSINSAFIRALYDLAFGYEGGNPNRPAIAAGAALRGAFRSFFAYRGAFFWKMNAGMGDVVFAPFYSVLKRRGVRFEFFHKLTEVNVNVGSESPHVDALRFDVQARVADGREYEPLRTYQGLACWPAEPDFGQLEGGAALAERKIDFESQWDEQRVESKTLRVAVDFDLVVLGVGLGVLPYVCAPLIKHSARYRAMVEHVKSVPTQAFQLWLNRDIQQLGWKSASINVSGFVEPFDTWADMTHLAAREDWTETPKSIAYFCNVLPDRLAAPFDPPPGAELVRLRLAEVKENARAFLRSDIAWLWPAALEHGDFCWDALCDARSGAASARGEARLSTQYFTANVRPSDKYSQALPGTTKYRISPLDRSFDNLTLAGDYTECGINMGCVEAAVMSGLLAAHAISGTPALSDITGYDHP